MVLTVAQLDDAIDALATGAASWTLPNGTQVRRTEMKDLMELRKFRKAEEDNAEGGIVAQYVEFGE